MRVFLVYPSVLPSARSDVCSDAEIFPYVTRATCRVSSAVPKNRSVRPKEERERQVHWLFPFFSLLGSSTFWHVIGHFVVAPKTSPSRNHGSWVQRGSLGRRGWRTREQHLDGDLRSWSPSLTGRPTSLSLSLSFPSEAITHSNYAYRRFPSRIRASFKARGETNARGRKKGRVQRLLRQIKNRARARVRKRWKRAEREREREKGGERGTEMAS